MHLHVATPKPTLAGVLPSSNADTGVRLHPFLQEVDLIRHRQDIRGGSGHWSFPKGHKIAGEDDQTSAIREFTEETGITDVRIIDPSPLLEHYSYYNRISINNKQVIFHRPLPV